MTSSKHLAEALIRILETKAPTPAVADALISFLQENHLTAMLPMVISSLEKRQVELEKLETAHVTLSHKIKPSALKDLEKIIKKKPQDSMAVSYDSGLIGGFLIRYRGREYDGSIKGQLRELKATLMK